MCPTSAVRNTGRITCHTVIALAVYLSALPALCAADQAAPITAADSLRVGFYDLKPLVFKDEQGMPQGLFIRVLEHVAAKEQWTLSYVHGSWPESLERLNRGEIDLLVSVSYSEERARTLDFNRDAVATDWGLLYRHKNSRLESIADLAGKRVSVMRTGIYTKRFKQLAEQFDVHMKFVERENYSQIIADVESGKSYAGIGSNLVGLSLEGAANVARSGIVFSPIKVMYAVRKGEHPEIIRAIDHHLKELKSNHESFYYDELAYMTGKPEEVIPKEVYWAVPSVAAALLIAVAFIILLRSQVRRKTEELINSNKNLQEQSKLLESIINGTTDAVFIKDTKGQYIVVNNEVVRLFGVPREEIIGRDDTWFFPLEEAQTVISSDKAIMAGGKVVTKDEYVTTLGSPKVYQATKGPVYDVDGNVIGLFGISRDITEIKQSADALLALKNELQTQNEELLATEEMLRVQINEHEISKKMLKESERRYRLITENVAAIPWEYNIPENRWSYIGPQVERLLGYPPDQWTTFESWLERIHPEDRNWVPDYCATLTAKGEDHGIEYRFQTKNGETVWVNDLITVEMREGQPVMMRGILLDITERKMAEEERIRLEGQLLQAQKMESVGRLAGGVAHDFNNKLSVIIGHSYLAISETDPDQIKDSLMEIRIAAEQSADLTRQLLAFARKQTISPSVLNLNEVVAGMIKMLNRVIGEDILLNWRPATDLWLIRFDPSQIDQILANLCINARDSISEEGKITIETKNCIIAENYATRNVEVIPGEYVQLSISDNGCGMGAETLHRIFEPFFTTKETGRGTGLGLATVYGIIKQNNGFIDVCSEPGTGTTFTIYLPRHVGEKRATDQKSMVSPVPVGQETILLVEDERAILNMASAILNTHGYTVLAANSPAEAIELAKACNRQIDLLITDVIMPEMNGKNLSLIIQSLNPQLKCLFMSGYTADVIAHHGVLDEEINFIQKPFSLPDLAAKVREVIDSDSRIPLGGIPGSER